MKPIRLGIFGANRGGDNFEAIRSNEVQIVSICDKDQWLLERAKNRLGDVAVFTDFDAFLDSGIDAVYIANYFSEHAPFAVKALEKGIHVLSECIPASTMAECVALVRTAEKSGALYMLAENYPYMTFNREMQRVYREGTLGRVLFAEGEYNHPIHENDTYFVARYYDCEKHWRNYLPATYYLTHSLGPLMMATRSNPVRVTALPIFRPKSENALWASHVGDNTAIITTLNDDDSVFRITGWGGFGAAENSYRLACEKGQIENVRGTDGKIMLTYNPWDVPEGMERSNFYAPQLSPEDAELASRAGHGGSDLFMFRDFFRCIREGVQPYLNVYTAVRMASVGILAHRSLMEFGVPYDIPDFSTEEARVRYENDTATPFWGLDGSAPTIPCCSHPDYQPSKEMVERFNRVDKTRW